MEAAYFQAAIPEPYRILGLALKPLSLGRYRLLKRFGCAFVADGEASGGINDLLLGLVICSMRVDEFLDALQAGSLHGQIRRWGRRVCPFAWLGLLPIIGRAWRQRHAFNVVEKMALFSRYLTDGSRAPKYWEGDTDHRPSGAHWSQAMEVTLMSQCGWTAEEINERPLTKALADYFQYAESQGVIRLMTSDEIAAIEAAENSKGGHRGA